MTALPNARIPTGSIADAWRRTKEELPLISPLRKGQLKVLVVGTGLAGASAAATLAQQGYQVTVLSFHDSPRRAHSVAAQGASTPPARLLSMATVSADCLLTHLKVVTSVRVKRVASA